MPRCLFLAPFPIAESKFGGQIHAANLKAAARLAGWDVESVGIFLAAWFPPSVRGPLDIILDSPELRQHAMSDLAFADAHIASAAARDGRIVEKLRSLILRLEPDVIQVEHPWGWLPLQAALPPSHDIRIVYSSHNIEWAARESLFRFGLKRTTSNDMLAVVRALEQQIARAADLVFSISDIEASEIQRVSGRPVIYLPAASQQRSPKRPASASRFAAAATMASCRYAALMGSAYWPNVEGYFSIFTDGLGFLARDEQIWFAGTLGDAVRNDARFGDFLSVNESRSRNMGYVAESEKDAFLADANCIIVPVTSGAGAKLKTADAIVSGRPVVATQHAVDGYGPIIEPALGNGVYVADTAKAFRALVRQALRHHLPGCPAAVRAQLSLEAMSKTWALHVGRLLKPAGERRS